MIKILFIKLIHLKLFPSILSSSFIPLIKPKKLLKILKWLIRTPGISNSVKQFNPIKYLKFDFLYYSLRMIK